MKHEIQYRRIKGEYIPQPVLELLITRYLTVIISIFYRFCCKLSYKGGDYGRQYRSASP